MTNTNCFIKLALFMIKDDALCVLLDNGKLPMDVTLAEDVDFHYAARRIATPHVGDADFQLHPVATNSGQRIGSEVPSDQWCVLQLDMGLARPEQITPEAAEMFVPVAEVEDLADLSDVGDINLCLATLKKLSHRSKWPMFLLDREFTLAEMRRAYELTSGLEIAEAPFRRKVLSEGIVKEVGTRRGLQTRPAALYEMVGVLMEFEKNLAYTPRT